MKCPTCTDTALVMSDRHGFEIHYCPQCRGVWLDRGELDKLGAIIADLGREMPPDLPWILRVDGHTDNRPIRSPQFPSNWHLSAARAIAVVEYLVTKGISADRIAATGFG
eukprot:gene35179-39792_t